MFAGQIDRAVGEEQRDLIQRKISEAQFLAVERVVVPVCADQHGGVIGADFERPDLKLGLGQRLVVGLDDGDFVQEPVRASVVGNVSSAVCVDDSGIDRMPVPVLRGADRPS